MARAAAEWDSTADGDLSMAIIVGQKHVEGIAHHLRTSHGYQNVTLDD